MDGLKINGDDDDGMGGDDDDDGMGGDDDDDGMGGDDDDGWLMVTDQVNSCKSVCYRR